MTTLAFNNERMRIEDAIRGWLTPNEFREGHSRQTVPTTRDPRGIWARDEVGELIGARKYRLQKQILDEFKAIENDPALQAAKMSLIGCHSADQTEQRNAYRQWLDNVADSDYNADVSNDSWTEEEKQSPAMPLLVTAVHRYDDFDSPQQKQHWMDNINQAKIERSAINRALGRPRKPEEADPIFGFDPAHRRCPLGMEGEVNDPRNEIEPFNCPRVVHMPSLFKGLFGTGLRAFLEQCKVAAERPLPLSMVETADKGLTSLPFDVLRLPDLPPGTVKALMLSSQRLHRSLCCNAPLMEAAYTQMCVEEAFPEPGSKLFANLGKEVSRDCLCHRQGRAPYRTSN